MVIIEIADGVPLRTNHFIAKSNENHHVGGCLNLPWWCYPLMSGLTDESQLKHIVVGKKSEKRQGVISKIKIINGERLCKFVAIELQSHAILFAEPAPEQTHSFVALISPKSKMQLQKHMCLSERSLSVSVISV